jgi:hypothetical protein
MVPDRGYWSPIARRASETFPKMLFVMRVYVEPQDNLGVLVL